MERGFPPKAAKAARTKQLGVRTTPDWMVPGTPTLPRTVHPPTTPCATGCTTWQQVRYQLHRQKIPRSSRVEHSDRIYWCLRVFSKQTLSDFFFFSLNTEIYTYTHGIKFNGLNCVNLVIETTRVKRWLYADDWREWSEFPSWIICSITNFSL